jgi:hypothetical protein
MHLGAVVPYPLGTHGAAPMRKLLFVDRGSSLHRDPVTQRDPVTGTKYSTRGEVRVEGKRKLPSKETMGLCQRAARHRKRERCQRRALCGETKGKRRGAHSSPDLDARDFHEVTPIEWVNIHGSQAGQIFRQGA